MASLQDLGLSPYEERAYETLLQTGPTTAKALSDASDVPMGRIYDVLNALEDQQLLHSQPERRPTQYVAVEPGVALERLLTDRKRELAAQEASYERIAAELETKLHRTTPVDAEFWTAAVGQDEAAALYAERVAGAQRRVRLVAGRPVGTRPAIAPEAVATALTEGRNREIAVEILISTALRDALSDRDDLERWLSVGTLRAATDVTGRYCVVDERELCLVVSHPLVPSEVVGLLVVIDQQLTDDVSEELTAVWTAADPIT